MRILSLSLPIKEGYSLVDEIKVIDEKGIQIGFVNSIHKGSVSMVIYESAYEELSHKFQHPHSISVGCNCNIDADEIIAGHAKNRIELDLEDEQSGYGAPKWISENREKI